MNKLLLTLLFTNTSHQFGLPNNMLYSLCYIESRHNIAAIHKDDGKTNSLGICQVKYETAKWLGFKGTEKQLMNPATNIYYAGKYLAYQRSRYHSNMKAIVAYNIGNANKLTSTYYSDKVIKYWGNINEQQASRHQARQWKTEHNSNPF